MVDPINLSMGLVTEGATVVPPWRALPQDRSFSAQLLDLRERIFAWLEPYYDRDHLTRAGDWMLAVAPHAPEHLIVAALTHDLERSVPGGPVLDKGNTPWDDIDYNRAHCDRSARIVSQWLREQGASDVFVQGVRQPIREHEFGGSTEGDLMQAVDSISFLETNGDLVARWVLDGDCTLEKGREKLRWMYERIRLGHARGLARPHFERAMAEVDRRVGERTSGTSRA